MFIEGVVHDLYVCLFLPLYNQAVKCILKAQMKLGYVILKKWHLW